MSLNNEKLLLLLLLHPYIVFHLFLLLLLSIHDWKWTIKKWSNFQFTLTQSELSQSVSKNFSLLLLLFISSTLLFSWTVEKWIFELNDHAILHSIIIIITPIFMMMIIIIIIRFNSMCEMRIYKPHYALRCIIELKLLSTVIWYSHKWKKKKECVCLSCHS